MASDRAERHRSRSSGGRAKGLAKATRAAIFVERTHRVLSREAEEVLFEHAELLTEGSAGKSGRSASFFGSTMITIDLDRISPRLRGLETDGMREALREAVSASARVRLRAMRLACAEVARRVPEREFGTAQVEIRVTLAGSRLHLDVDVEVPFDQTSERNCR
ncbi:MAG: hypothetical protein H5U40_19065 [Polyangiaceae bacterium]|nr:hypothetical protein [Polyangiaceae bacterium]